MATTRTQLDQLEIHPWRALVIAAHPGDIEYAASAAVAKWTSEGVEVVYLIASRGETSLPGVEPEQAALIRSGEQSASAAVVGVHIVDFLDVDDGTIEPTIALRRSIVASIRRFAPDVVLIMNHRERRIDGTHNHADHRAVGNTALDAIASSANQWVFRDIGKPHSVDVVLVAGSPLATHEIDVSGFEKVAVAALSTHKQHLEAIAPHAMADPATVLDALKASGNTVVVERIEFGQGQPCQSHIVKEIEDEDGPLPVGKLSKRTKLSQAPARSRNAAPRTRPARNKTSAPKKAASKAVEPTGTITFKARLEQQAKSIGIEIPERIMERLSDDKRPAVTVSLKALEFETAIGMSGGRRFVAINAERRKKADIELNDTFFVTLSLRSASTK